ncbi:MAG TPA: hypothetical protein DCQ29_06735 [Chitinophagaceae bacterium]|nr:hypothetical protein [Chitinophagaceae bacterium]
MMFRWTLFLLLCSIATHLQSQQLITGIVKDASNQQPISGASVFVNNTSIGTVTNSEGAFALTVNYQQFDLVVSSIGFENAVIKITTTNVAMPQQVLLKPKPKELEAVTVAAFEKDGWNKWGRLFTELFIGVMPEASSVTIMNSDKIKFRYKKKEKLLEAIAFEPIIIKNNYLGYTLQYDLVTFEYTFSNKSLLVAGYPLFIPMEGNEAKQRKWERHRKEAYEGSTMHFMRSIYRNKLAQDGFQIRVLQRFENTERTRVALRTQSLYNNNDWVEQSTQKGTQAYDSAKYYTDILKQPKVNSVLSQQPITPDSIAYAIDSTTLGVFFNHYIEVRYNKKETTTYAQLEGHEPYPFRRSNITLVKPDELVVLSSGMHFEGTNLLRDGYWAYSEKIAYMLPFDYWPKP